MRSKRADWYVSEPEKKNCYGTVAPALEAQVKKIPDVYARQERGFEEI